MQIEVKRGIILSFDDINNIDFWYKAKGLFEDFNAKATFFINSPDRLIGDQLKKLRELHNLGHEIGYHGWRHRKAVDYCSEKGIEAWLLDEIVPGIELLKKQGFEISSFAYPYSQRNQQTDDALKDYFCYARTSVGVCGQQLVEQGIPSIPSSEVRGKFLFPGMNIDGKRDIQIVKAVLTKIAEQSDLAVLYGHGIGEEGASTGHLTNNVLLHELLAFGKSQNLQFFSFSKLGG